MLFRDVTDDDVRRAYRMTDSAELSSQLNPEVPHSARIWNYLLGGKDNFVSDRVVADQVKQGYPEIVDIAVAGRRFLKRAVTYLAGEAGVRQFLDLGTGLPTADNTHEVAQALAPDSRIVYVDNDPLVLVHARALLTSTPEGATDYISADVHDPRAILDAAARTLNFRKPIALMMLGILGHVADDDQPSPAAIVSTLVHALPRGSYLVINDSVTTSETVDAVETARSGGANYNLRTPTQMERFFGGLELVEPGLVPTPTWRPAPNTGAPQKLDVYCGVARKP
jgi:hypothetical protein